MNSKHSMTHHTLGFFFYLKEIFFPDYKSYIYLLKIENKTQKCVKRMENGPNSTLCVDKLFVLSSFM